MRGEAAEVDDRPSCALLLIVYIKPMAQLKPVEWIGSSRDDLKSFPGEVREVIGEALYRAQQGAEHPVAKALKGFGGRGVLEVVEDFRGDTFRAVYTVRFAVGSMCCTYFRRRRRKELQHRGTRSN